jgi:hypothetical protein
VENEPNDSFDSAEPVICGGAVTAAIGVAGDQDFFRLTGIPANSKIGLDLTSPGTCSGGVNDTGSCTGLVDCAGGFCEHDVDLVLSVYAADQELLFVVDDTESDTDPRSTHAAQSSVPTDRFLVISPFGTETGSYSFRGSRSAT